MTSARRSSLLRPLAFKFERRALLEALSFSPSTAVIAAKALVPMTDFELCRVISVICHNAGDYPNKKGAAGPTAARGQPTPFLSCPSTSSG
jgi:hypothetical protein